MISRLSFLPKRLVRPNASFFKFGGTPTRNFASQKEMKDRITAVTNIEKITNAMKLVATTRMAKAQARCMVARDFIASFEEDIVTPPPKEEDKDKMPETWKFVPITSDRGLCGGCNVVVLRNVRDTITELRKNPNASGIDLEIMPIGEKGRQGLERVFGTLFKTSFTDALKHPMNFPQSAELAVAALEGNPEKLEFVYNYFRSLIAFETKSFEFKRYDDVVGGQYQHKGYSLEGPSDILNNYHEFRMACWVFYIFAESEVVELSSRMQAMTNSSKNAGEMIDSLTLIMNRKRQAKITNELMEIVVGTEVVMSELANKR